MINSACLEMEVKATMATKNLVERNGNDRRRGDLGDEVLKLWGELSSEKKELLIPRLLCTTRLGSRMKEAGLAWRPAYMERVR